MINLKKLYESLTNEALIENLIEESKISAFVLSFDRVDYDKKIEMMKQEIIKRIK